MTKQDNSAKILKIASLILGVLLAIGAHTGALIWVLSSIKTQQETNTNEILSLRVKYDNLNNKNFETDTAFIKFEQQYYNNEKNNREFILNLFLSLNDKNKPKSETNKAVPDINSGVGPIPPDKNH